jgi:Fe(3+) dicitrate transport protein
MLWASIFSRYFFIWLLEVRVMTFLASSMSKSHGDAGNSPIPSKDAVAGIIPAYSVLDWSCAFHLMNYNLKFGINNLADRRYFTLRSGQYPGPGIIPSTGRSMYVSMGVKF